MVIPPIECLRWGQDRHPRTRINLGASGVPDVAPEALGDAPAVAERASLGRFLSALAVHLGRPEEELAPSLGASHAIWQTCVATLDVGDVVAVESPGFEPFVRVPEALGMNVVRFERRPEDGFVLDPDRVVPALRAGAKLVFVTDLHNPSGVALPEETLLALARHAESHRALVVVDEVYRAFDPSRLPVSNRSLHPAIVALSSLTKVYGLGWARVGWLAGPSEVAAQARTANLHVAGVMPFPSAAYGLRALERLSALQARTDAIIGQKRERFEAWLASRPDVTWTPPAHGLFGVVRVAGLSDARAFVDALHDETGVLVTPGSFFDLPDHLRLSWSESPERLEAGLQTLGRALDVLYR